jgi:excisionase family DNA binding protein
MVSLAQAARELGVPRSTLARWVLQGKVRGQRIGSFWALPAEEVERLQTEGRPKLGLPKGTRLTRRYQGTCQACGQAFTAARPAKFCSPRCSARFRARERTARRRGSEEGTAPSAEGLRGSGS